jgi:hypothetical protein
MRKRLITVVKTGMGIAALIEEWIGMNPFDAVVAHPRQQTLETGLCAHQQSLIQGAIPTSDTGTIKTAELEGCIPPMGTNKALVLLTREKQSQTGKEIRFNSRHRKGLIGLGPNLQMGMIETSGEMQIPAGITLIPKRQTAAVLNKFQDICAELKIVFEQQKHLGAISPGPRQALGRIGPHTAPNRIDRNLQITRECCTPQTIDHLLLNI